MKNWLSIIFAAGSTFVASKALPSSQFTGLITARAPLDARVTPAPSPTLSDPPPVITTDGADLVIILDAETAQKMDDTIHAVDTCPDGSMFDANNKRDLAFNVHSRDISYANVVCGAEVVMAMTGPGGMFANLLVMNRGHIAFRLTDAAGIVSRVAAMVLTFAQSFAHLAAMDPAALEELVIFVVEFSLETLQEGRKVSETNRIQTSIVSISVSASQSLSSKSCPDPKATPLFCEYENENENDCKAIIPRNRERKPFCASGEYEDCECQMPYRPIFDTIPMEDWGRTFSFWTRNVPKCENGLPTRIPQSVFNGGIENNVFKRFCDAWSLTDHKTEMHWTVDANGLNRTLDPGSLDFDLSYVPNSQGGSPSCAQNCLGAFVALGGECWTGHDPEKMVINGNLDVGCGYFAYNIQGQPTLPKAMDRFCFQTDQFGKHKDVHEKQQGDFARDVCNGRSGPVRRGDVNSQTLEEREYKGAPYQYRITWKDDCVLDSDDGVQEMDGKEPIPGVSCEDFMIGNYKQCLNGGLGGSIQVGCLVYEFKAASIVFGN